MKRWLRTRRARRRLLRRPSDPWYLIAHGLGAQR